MRPRTFGGEIGEADGKRLVGDRVRRIAGKKVHAADDRVAGGDELLALRDRQHRGIVKQAEGGGVGGERREIAGDDLELAARLAFAARR